MLAVGCMIPFVLIVAGAIGGWALGGQADSVIGAIAGGVVGVIAMAALAWGWDKIVSRRE